MKSYSKINFTKILIYLFFIELFVGGSGRIFQFGEITLRMALFVIIYLNFFIDIILRRVKVIITIETIVVIIILLWVFFSYAIGILNGNNPDYIINDISPMSFFLILFPLQSYSVKYDISIQKIYNILLHSIFVMSIVLILLTISLKVTFGNNVYLITKSLSIYIDPYIFWYRPSGGIFYPGLLFSMVLNIIIFNKFMYSKLNNLEKIVFLLSLVTIILSVTKGLILSLLFGYLILLLRYGIMKKINKVLVLFILTLIIIFGVVNEIDLSRLLYSNIQTDSGVQTRALTFSESISKIESSPIIGNGFGTVLESKSAHQENSYLDIWVEQGAIGLVLFLLLFFLLLRNNKSYKFSIMMGFQTAVISTILLSATNPYINNPLGISVIIMSIIFKKSSLKEFKNNYKKT